MLHGRSTSLAKAASQSAIGLLILAYMLSEHSVPRISQFLLATSQHKFAYPVTTSFTQLALVYILLVCAALLSTCAHYIIPRATLKGQIMLIDLREEKDNKSRAIAFSAAPAWQAVFDLRLPSFRSYHWHRARQFFPLAVTYTADVVLSNHLIAYTDMPLYRFSRLLSVTLGITGALMTTTEYHTPSNIACAAVATLNMTLLQSHLKRKYPFETLVLGAFASIAVAIYPSMLLRTYRGELNSLANRRERRNPTPLSASSHTLHDRILAGWNVLYYTALLSLTILTPLWLMSGDITHIAQNYYYLTEPEFWVDIAGNGLFTWLALCMTIIMVVACSPLVALFMVVPRVAFEIWMSKQGLGITDAHSSIRLIVCSVSCLWFLIGKCQLHSAH